MVNTNTSMASGIVGNQPQTASGAASEKFNADFNSFLQLLTTQLQNQDPLAPMDSSQFVTQLTQLSGVEQAIKTNSNLETMLSTLNAQGSKGDIAMLGKSVAIYSNQVHLSEGNAEFLYQLAENAKEATVIIKDQGGNPIKTITGVAKTMGVQHPITWDGTDDYGNPMADGNYQIEISATNEAGGNILSDTIAKTKVLQVGLENGLSHLVLDNGEKVDPIEVQSVS